MTLLLFMTVRQLVLHSYMGSRAPVLLRFPPTHSCWHARAASFTQSFR